MQLKKKRNTGKASYETQGPKDCDQQQSVNCSRSFTYSSYDHSILRYNDRAIEELFTFLRRLPSPQREETFVRICTSHIGKSI